jgi:predicted nuclease of predicted toxin-antitoxin system
MGSIEKIMKLYLDDDSVAAVLVALLRRDGHDVQLPMDAGLSGKDDPIHLAHAVLQNRVFLSHNYNDFKLLHDLVVAVQGHHPGILVVRKDNDPKRDLTMNGIVRALAKLVASGTPITDEYHILNHWR